MPTVTEKPPTEPVDTYRERLENSILQTHDSLLRLEEDLDKVAKSEASLQQKRAETRDKHLFLQGRLAALKDVRKELYERENLDS